jgi:hypothetical protein
MYFIMVFDSSVSSPPQYCRMLGFNRQFGVRKWLRPYTCHIGVISGRIIWSIVGLRSHRVVSSLKNGDGTNNAADVATAAGGQEKLSKAEQR